MPQLNKQPAYSLVFAFIMMTLIMVVASTSITNTQEKIRYFNELEATSQARLSALSAAEIAVGVIKDAELGYETEAEDAFCVESDRDCQSWGDYVVYASAAENDNYGSKNFYFTPRPNTGNAVPDGECSILDSHEDVDHACNWNKLVYGESVSIPLTGVDKTLFQNPNDLGLEQFFLKVRTPCENGSYEEDCDNGDGDTSDDVRYEFDESSLSYPDEHSADNPTIVLWSIVGESSVDGSVSLVPDDNTEDHGYEYKDTEYFNTEIFLGLINDPSQIYGPDLYTSYGDHIVLIGEDSSYSGNASDGMEEIYDTLNDSNLTELQLQLTIISSLVDDTGSSIPYLEWQVMTNNLYGPFADTKSMIIGEGYHKIGSETYYHPVVVSRSSIDSSTSIYTLSN